jgi:hypothetical protein
LNSKDINKTKDEIISLFTSLFENVDNLISDMKLSSSDEILNGSLTEAQALLGQIISYQKFHEKLKETKVVFDEINSVSKEDINFVKEKIETLNQKEIDESIAKDDKKAGENKNVEITSQLSYRIPVLKALIYLGGSSEEVEVTDFVKREFKNKFTKKDLEIPEGEDRENWISNLYFETATMADEGLLIKESSNKKWEIVQKGIDYLSKYAK